MRMRAAIALAAVAATAAATAMAQGPAGPPAPSAPLRVKADHPGRVVFDRQCAPCHAAGPGDDGAPMLPGTMALAVKYRGRLPAELELRDDINAETLRYFVRNGSGAMPTFRKAELSDSEIDAVAGYLSATARANGRPKD